MLFLALLSFFIVSRISKSNFRNRFLWGISIQLIFISVGFFITEIRDVSKNKYYFSNYSNVSMYCAEISDAPEARNGRLRLFVKVKSVLQYGCWKKTDGNCYLYIADTDSLKVYAGDKILFKKAPDLILEPLNPGQFNFKNYCLFKRIHHQLFLRDGGWLIIKSIDKINVKAIAAQIRGKLLSAFRFSGIGGQEYAVLSALVLGYDDEIDNETLNAFSASGTLHVLSVSGMHVGIIYAALSSLLSFMGRKKSLQIVRLVILIFTLWFYAVLTGFSPSVIRSAMMFTFILIGRSLSRSSTIFNSLALAALCIFIFFDSLMLFEPGLQLSFLAVGGIGYLYPHIYNLTTIRNVLADKVWALVAVSIAAQAATFPISIYYFHQFPNYFIPANILIIPLATAGIFGGIILLFLTPFPIVYLYAGYLVQKIIFLLNESAIIIEHMPGSVWRNISISFSEMIVIYFILLMVFLFLTQRSVKYLYNAQLFSILLITLFITHTIGVKANRSLIIFSGTKKFSFQAQYGFKTLLVYKSIDSLKALNLSNSYLKQIGLSEKDRTIIVADSDCVIKSRTDIYIEKNMYVIGQIILGDASCNIPLKSTSTIIYAETKQYSKFRFDSLDQALIVVNDKSYNKSFIINIPKNKNNIHLLSKGAKIIDL